MAKLSPMMEQYFEIKKNYEDTLLFFRLGDFYEMFFEDAKVASKELELVYTPDIHTIEDICNFLKTPLEESCKAVVYQKNMTDEYVVIGAGAVVTKEITESKVVVGGVPSKIIKKLQLTLF